MSIPAPELAAMQAVFNNSLDKTCAIQRNSNLGTPDQYGTVAAAWATVPGLAAVACSLSEPTGTYMQNLAARLGNQAAWQISLPFGTSLVRGDRIIQGNETFTVQSVAEPHSYPLGVRALVSEVR